ncbi:hypothetical protein [Pseudomonas sp.]|uniref:hypothetical protein n=1 Tax=Pseudomonas sp. TaxID=306 RepID=UPI00290B556F|nr:hypothetical protein [Pseudomonas sp.]MDU4253927.1 hypothetical protein [Pseudomonas sp.]
MADRNNTTASMVADLRALTEPSGQSRSALKAIPPRGPLEAQRGRGDYQEKATGTGGGIANPLIEVAGTVAYWPNGYMSSDGLFVLPAVKTRQFLDANDDTVDFQFANPEGSA